MIVFLDCTFPFLPIFWWRIEIIDEIFSLRSMGFWETQNQEGLVLKEMLEAGSDLYGELAGMGSRKRAAVSKAPKASKLRNTDPWKWRNVILREGDI